VSEPRPFNMPEIAKHLAAGDTVRIGEHFVAHATHDTLFMQCTACVHGYSVLRSQLREALPEIMAFVEEHFHGAKGWQ
jgi:hypothetical protein